MDKRKLFQYRKVLGDILPNFEIVMQVYKIITLSRNVIFIGKEIFQQFSYIFQEKIGSLGF